MGATKDAFLTIRNVLVAKMSTSPTLPVLISKLNGDGDLDSNHFKIGEKTQNTSRASPHDPFYMEVLWLVSDGVNPYVPKMLGNKRY